MALSDDASTLWVGIDGALGIRKMTLTSTPVGQGPLIGLPPQSVSIGTPNTAGAMVVLPGAPTSIVLETASTGLNATYVLDDGVVTSITSPLLTKTRP